MNFANIHPASINPLGKKQKIFNIGILVVVILLIWSVLIIDRNEKLLRSYYPVSFVNASTT